jgi:hypothetical protein
MVDRVRKLTGFSIFARIRSAETCFSAFEMRLSTAMGSAALDPSWLCATASLLTASSNETKSTRDLFLRGKIM